MKAIVGLGNPGPRYRATRHNVGWQVVDRLIDQWRATPPVQARHAEVSRATVEGETVLLVKPQTFMNDSGKAVRALVEKDGLRPEEILVIYDDLDLAPGRIRVRAQGSAGGHRGIRSIQEQLAAVWRTRGALLPAGAGASHGAGAPHFEAAAPGAGVAVATAKGVRPEPPAFPRIKVGIGRPPAGVDPIDFVLTRFDPHELLVVQPAIERAAEAAAYWVHAGAEAAANRFNAG